MSEEKFDNYLKEQLHQEVGKHLGRLEGLEDRVLEELGERALRRGPGARLRGFLAAPVVQRPGWALAATAVIFLALGVFFGMQFEGPSFGGKGVWFVVAYPEAQSVTVAGDFNGWTDTPLKQREAGIWMIRLDLEPGRYEYSFKIDGKKWVPDPRADEYVKTYGDQYNSVIYV